MIKQFISAVEGDNHMTSNHWERMIEEVYRDSNINPGEIMRLRDEVNRAEDRVLSADGYEGTMAALCKSFDVTNQLLQDSLLLTNQGKYSDTGQEMIRSVLAANIQLLQATLDAFT
jgi:hypothetical protein